MGILERNGAIAVPRPNWSRPVGVEYTFKTGILTSRDGTENRSALRQSARTVLKFSSMLSRQGIARWNADMASAQSGPTAVRAEWLRGKLGADALVGAFEFSVSSVPWWLVAEAVVILTDDTHEEVVEVTSVTDDVASFATALTHTFAEGTRVNLAYWCQPSDKAAFSAETATLWTGNLRFDVLPVPAPLPKGCPLKIPHFYKGHELLLTKPNWVDRPRITFLQERDTFDPGVGSWATVAPERANHIQTQLGLTGLGSASAQHLVDFFTRKKGRRTSFWMPTWIRDIQPSETAPPTTTSFLIDGLDFRNTYADDEVFQAMIVLYPDGSYQANRLTSITGGVDSLLEFQDEWLIPVGAADRIMWLPLWRFATDTLEVQWVTDTIAETQYTVKTVFANFDDSQVLTELHKGTFPVVRSPPNPAPVGVVFDLYEHCTDQAEIDLGDIVVEASWSALLASGSENTSLLSSVGLFVDFHNAPAPFGAATSVAALSGEVTSVQEYQTEVLSAGVGPLTVPPGARYVRVRADYTRGVLPSIALSTPVFRVSRVVQRGVF